MVQPKYSPEEALQRVKLMMGYDLKKSLRENVITTGVVLNEQDGLASDAIVLHDEIDSTFSDEQKLIDIIKKYKSSAEFQSLLNFYKKTYNKDLGLDLARAVDIYNDKKESKDLEQYLQGIGVKVKFGQIGDGRGTSSWFFEIGAQDGAKKDDRQQNINNTYCSVKDGIIVNPKSTFNGTKWENWKKTYVPTDAEIEVAKKSCPAKKTTVYPPCAAGKYVRPCKSDVVKKVQACLGMPEKYQTGNFGPITQSYLTKLGKGYENGFNDGDVDIICKTQTAEVKPEVGGEKTTVKGEYANF